MYVMRSLLRTVLKNEISIFLLLPNVAPEYATMNIQEKWQRLKPN